MIRRSRPWLAAGIGAVVAWGLASRRFSWLFPVALGKYPGDALWALMVFLGMALICPGASTLRLALLAATFSFAIEASQLYQAPWLNDIRSTTLGHLVLGSSFDGWDLVAYSVGIAAGALCDALLRRR